MKSIADIRTDYTLSELDEESVGSDPFLFFSRWFTEAEKAEVMEVNAMTLATVDSEGKPHARIVLLKALDDKGFTFFTNYNSHKGQQLAASQKAALVFFWPELQRQVRIEGIVEKVSTEESDTYFASRPAGSQLGAWASPQSAIINNRTILEHNLQKIQEQFKAAAHIPRPQHWGGYRVLPYFIEFWQGRANRLHDRIAFKREADSSWQKNRLAP